MSKTFCPLPWTHLATHPHGVVSLCCEASNVGAASHSHNLINGRKIFKTLNTEKYDFKIIHNSELFKKTRKSMLEGEIPEPCKKCYQLESMGLESKRIRESNRLNFKYEDALKITDTHGSIFEIDFEFIELRLGNHCNLACRTCNPYSSTKLKTDWIKIHGEQSFNLNQQLFDWPFDDNFWTKLNANSKKLRYVYINGGEPLLLDKHKKFLQLLIDRDDAKNIQLNYSTNGTTVKEIYENLWKEFKLIEISVSIDDLEERNSYIRYPSSWQDIMKFLSWLEDIKNRNQNIRYSILQTVSLMNVYYMPEFYDYFNGKNLVVSHNFVSEPDYFNISNLPQDIKGKILNKIKNYPFYNDVMNLMNLNRSEEKFNKFIEITKNFDLIRNQSFDHTFYDYAKIIKNGTYEE